MKKLLAIFTLFLSINSAEIQHSKFWATGSDSDLSEIDSDKLSSPVKKRRGSQKNHRLSAKALARQQSAELQPVFLTPPRPVTGAESVWSTQSSLQGSPLSNISNISIESRHKRKTQDREVSEALKDVREINEEEVDDGTRGVIERALEVADKKLIHTTPQRRAFNIYSETYRLLTGQYVESASPFRLEADKLRYLMKFHKEVLSRIDKYLSDRSFLENLESEKFSKYLRQHNLETIFIDVEHIFDGGEKGGAHVYTKRDDERFQKEVIEPSTMHNKKVHTNRSNGVIYGYKNEIKSSSIFPRHLKSVDIFGILRGADTFESGYGNRRLIKKGNLYIELYLQLNGRLVKSAFPIFSFIDLNNFDEHDVINTFTSEIQKIDIEFFDLIAAINKALLSSVESDHDIDNLPFRYFIDTNDIIIDIASILDNEYKTDIKSGLYVQVNMDRLDPALVQKAKERYSERHVRDLTSPFSDEVPKRLAALCIPCVNDYHFPKPPRVPRRPPVLNMAPEPAGPAE